MKALVTGSSGYIAAWLINSLKSRGYTVRGVDRSPKVHDRLDEFVQGDILDSAVSRKCLDGVEIVFHLAAAKHDWGISDKEYFRDNIDATSDLISCGSSKGIKKWVFYSSVSAMGQSIAPLDESAPLAPTNPYGISKAECEKMFAHLTGQDRAQQVLVIRPSVVYGPGNYPNTNVYRLIDTIYKGTFVMVGHGQVVKTTSYIENLIDATHFLVDRLAEGVRTFIYVDSPPQLAAELVSKISELLGKAPPRFHLPLKVAINTAVLADALASVIRIDLPITKARIKKFCTATNFDSSALRKLGFIQRVSNEEALRRTVQWYLTQQKCSEVLRGAAWGKL